MTLTDTYDPLDGWHLHPIEILVTHPSFGWVSTTLLVLRHPSRTKLQWLISKAAYPLAVLYHPYPN